MTIQRKLYNMAKQGTLTKWIEEMKIYNIQFGIVGYSVIQIVGDCVTHIDNDTLNKLLKLESM